MRPIRCICTATKGQRADPHLQRANVEAAAVQEVAHLDGGDRLGGVRAVHHDVLRGRAERLKYIGVR